MIELRLGNAWVAADVEATERWYAQAAPWSCTCGHCRNFIALARARIEPLSSMVEPWLHRWHIPLEKATYVCTYNEDAGGLWYDFSYRIAGEILRQEETDAMSIADIYVFHEIYPYGAPDFPLPHFDLGFSLKLPWVLDEPL